MEHEWIKLRTRQPEQGNVERDAKQCLVKCSRNEGGEPSWSFCIKAFLTLLYLMPPKSCSVGGQTRAA